jgi:hypothetical protein
MGFFLAASLTFLNSNATFPGEDHGVLRRAVWYSQQMEGCVLSKCVGVGRTIKEVQQILGPCPGSGYMSKGVFDHYWQYGLLVNYYWQETEGALQVQNVTWRWTWFPRELARSKSQRP